MTDNPKLEENNMGPDCVSGQVNGLEHSSTKSDSFVVDMERFSHILEKDINAHSRITLQRNLSRKGTARTGENKVDRDTALLAISPKAAALHGGGGSTPEKAEGVVAVGPTDQSITPQVHHQITITNGSLNGVPAAVESKLGGRRFSFRRSSPPTWTLNPKRIFLFFATLSCMGTMVLIYFTLSMGNFKGDENALD
ncbi:hypothetical protein ABFS82_13G120700 [Erythranthe guttata]|uniref:Uncharacterized protein n=1 Tax=Erythranthe guttata TaxID=4155 RepID=A0A022QKN6_ERYGU|nr:PREDICTED: uncharacterized protein LOC105969199 isoform X1 [Erythranthe guttata]XP_012849403.1 PREDICTED: uncharacterized protein LOC105969199 isoform X1 [Erythranthe guttata]EYU27833.1 hypothetical protein MIMGU_mgv1a014265mg [Erythranthe guttata]|eukprot:XP_012849402.1 PREDICTED: uncharacterized protein LOC105969199 isoform X1 [Erythranthe guttata]